MKPDLAAYFERIGYTGPLDPTPQNLYAIHRAHVLNVPFENLDIHLGRPICLDLDAFFRKIVHQRRGGFCYELNGLLGHVLSQFGFDVTLLSARVYGPDGIPGRDFAHLFLLVRFPERYIADVGFGDASLDPLRLDCDDDQLIGSTVYRIVADTDRTVLTYVQADHSLKPKYDFALTPRLLPDFAGMCHAHQTECSSKFVQRRLCTRATPTGRITLSTTRLTIVDGDRRIEHPIASDAEFSDALRSNFQIEISPSAWRQPVQ